MQVRNLRRNNAGRYQVYLVDVLIDCCAAKSYFDEGNELIKRYLTIFFIHDSAIPKGCPFNVRIF